MKSYAIACINPSRNELWQIHKSGCADLTRNRWKHNIDQVIEVKAENAVKAEEAWLDEEMRGMGYKPGDGHVRIMPCCAEAK